LETAKKRKTQLFNFSSPLIRLILDSQFQPIQKDFHFEKSEEEEKEEKRFFFFKKKKMGSRK